MHTVEQSTSFLPCVGGGIPYCNVSVGGENTEDCSQCYPPFKVMEPLQFQDNIRKKAEKEVKEIGGHFKENCLEHAVCLTESQVEGVVFEYVRLD